MKNNYSLKSVLLGTVFSLIGIGAFGQASVNSVLLEETFGTFGTDTTIFTQGKSVASYNSDKKGTTTLVASDKSDILYSGDLAVIVNPKTAQTNMTAGHVWINKSTEGYITISGIKTYNAKKIKIAFSQAGKGTINASANFGDGETEVGKSTDASANFETEEFDTKGAELTLTLKRDNNTTNLRIDNIKVIVTEIETEGEPCEAPVIVSQPTNLSIIEGGPATFSVSATGEDLSYAWQTYNDASNDWATIDGEQGSTFTIPATQPSMNGSKYRVIVSSDTCNTISTEVQLTVSPGLAVGDLHTAPIKLVKNTLVTNDIIFGHDAKISLITMTGQVVKTAHVTANSRLDVSHLPKGSYLVVANINGKMLSQSIIKK